jgi:tetratricopeptide (TPR) repeat protein
VNPGGEPPVPEEPLPASAEEASSPAGETAAPGAEAPVGADEHAPAGEQPRSPASPTERGEPSRWVAVLIMVVTLLAAVFTFLQNASSNRAFAAARRSDAAAVEAQGEALRAAEHLSAQWRLWTLFLEESQITISLAGSAAEGTGALAQGSFASAMATASFAGFDLMGEFDEEWAALFGRTWSAVIRAGESQKAYAAERSAWGAKGSQFVAVVTVLAVALFLLGLSRTSVGASSGSLLVWSGLAVAGAASIWGLTVFLRPVAPPSAEAIDAYVEGQVALGSASGLEQLGHAEEAFTRALTARPAYSDAFFGRGLARAQIGLFQEGGPQGSEGARVDFERVVALDPLNKVAWGNLAVARLRLGDPGGATAAARRAVDIDPDDPAANLNLAALSLLAGDEEGYATQLAEVRAILGSGDVSESMRTYLFSGVWQELEMAKRYLPNSAAAAGRGQEDLLRVDHQILVAREFFGTGTPAPVAAAVSPLSFALSDDRTELRVTFDATGVAAGQRWLWRTYRAGAADPLLSHELEIWPFAVPYQQVAITLTRADGFTPGETVRVEVFIEGNLLQAGELTP